MPATTATTPDARSLDDLAITAQAGDKGAIADLLCALLVRLKPLVTHRIRGGRGALRYSDVDDLVQDLLMAVWQKDLPQFDPSRSGFLTFVNRRVSWHLAERARVARKYTGV